MKIVAISDTHEQENWIKYPPGDLLIHAGDMTNQGKISALNKFDNRMRTLSYEHKICVGGNHEKTLEANRELHRQVFNNIKYINDFGVEVEGIKIWGSPWTPRFFDWAFNLDRGRSIKEKWDLIPEDTEILITHGPPFEILDRTDGRYGPAENVGCVDLRNTVFDRLKNLKLHIFGHIHHGYGTHEENGILFVNASSCNEDYRPVNKPIVIDFEKGIGAKVADALPSD